jgi:hypothetical protein
VKPLSKKDALEKLHSKVAAARAVAGVPLRELSLEELEKRARKHKLGGNVNGWVNPYPSDDPRNLLLEYQFAWREDQARFKAGLMSRQSGKDFSSESEAAEDCHARPKTEWMIAAPSERQALDSLEQGKVWAAAFDLKIDEVIHEPLGLLDCRVEPWHVVSCLGCERLLDELVEVDEKKTARIVRRKDDLATIVNKKPIGKKAVSVIDRQVEHVFVGRRIYFYDFIPLC